MFKHKLAKIFIIIFMNTIADGARIAVKENLNIQPNERVVVITDRDTETVAQSFLTEIKKITELVDYFVMEDFGPRPLALPEKIKQALLQCDVSLYCAGTYFTELELFRTPMINAITGGKPGRHANMPAITEEIMKTGMCSQLSEMKSLSQKVYDLVKNAREMRILSDIGTDLILTLNPDYRWYVSDADITRPGIWTNLPGSEVFTCPDSVNGYAVIDGALGDFMSKKYGIIQDTPVKMEIKDGRAVRTSIVCKNDELQTDFINYLFNNDENSSRVGEIGIGTNTAIQRLTGVLLQDEKFPGAHIAFGYPAPEKTGATWNSKMHLDCIILCTHIFVDGTQIMRAGKFLI